MNYGDKMDEKEYQQMRSNIRKAISMYPNCYIANCSCNEYEGEWKKGCHCMGHFKMMDKIFGENNWNFSDFSDMANKGLTPEEYISKLKEAKK